MTPAETPKEPVRIPFTCAGAKMELDEKRIIHGEFHPIPLELWNAIIGFHRQVSINNDGESVSYHKWHPETESYHTIIPWQTTMEHGLSVDVNWREPRNQKLLDDYARLYKRDFFPACTIHTHVDAGAFESGTDAKDEEENPGWHITLGHLLDYERYDFDFRMRLPVLPRLNAVCNTRLSIKLKWTSLFENPKEAEDFIHTTPGTADFHAFLNRVSTSRSHHAHALSQTSIWPD